MQHSGLREISRIILTIAGIVLLLVFGSRAASQATSIAAVGGQAKKASLALFTPAQYAAMASADVSRVTHVVAVAPPATVPTEAQSNTGSATNETTTVSAAVEADVSFAVRAVNNVAQAAVTQVTYATNSVHQRLSGVNSESFHLQQNDETDVR